MLGVYNLVRRRSSSQQSTSDQPKMSSDQQSSFGFPTGVLPASFTQFRDPQPQVAFPPSKSLELVAQGQFGPPVPVSATAQLSAVVDRTNLACRAVENYQSELVKRDDRIHKAQQSVEAMVHWKDTAYRSDLDEIFRCVRDIRLDYQNLIKCLDTFSREVAYRRPVEISEASLASLQKSTNAHAQGFQQICALQQTLESRHDLLASHMATQQEVKAAIHDIDQLKVDLDEYAASMKSLAAEVRHRDDAVSSALSNQLHEQVKALEGTVQEQSLELRFIRSDNSSKVLLDRLREQLDSILSRLNNMEFTLNSHSNMFQKLREEDEYLKQLHDTSRAERVELRKSQREARALSQGITAAHQRQVKELSQRVHSLEGRPHTPTMYPQDEELARRLRVLEGRLQEAPAQNRNPPQDSARTPFITRVRSVWPSMRACCSLYKTWLLVGVIAILVVLLGWYPNRFSRIHSADSFA